MRLNARNQNQKPQQQMLTPRRFTFTKVQLHSILKVTAQLFYVQNSIADTLTDCIACMWSHKNRIKSQKIKCWHKNTFTKVELNSIVKITAQLYYVPIALADSLYDSMNACEGTKSESKATTANVDTKENRLHQSATSFNIKSYCTAFVWTKRVSRHS